jgi:hypothetical protein
MYLFCNSRIHVITLYSGHVCVYYASMLRCWHLVWILIRTDHSYLGVGCHKTAAPHHLPFPVFISRNRRHWSSTAVASLSFIARLPPPYEPIKGMMRAPPLSSAPTLAPISPPHTQNRLSIGAPPVASFERCCVVIYAALPPSDTISENPDDLLSLSLFELSWWPTKPRSSRTTPWSWVHHGPRDSCGPVIHRPD